MKNLKQTFFVLTIFMSFIAIAQEKNISIQDTFDKIIVSPHIEAQLIKGKTAGITIESIIVPTEKLQYEIKNGTLQVYLEGAKTYTKTKK